MEGTKGGNLAKLPDEAEKLMKDYNPEATIVSWAHRFIGSLPGVRLIPIGMPKYEYMVENCALFDNFVPLNDEEYEIIDKVVKIINEKIAIPCTYCRYCESKCPKKIDIPDYFSFYNSMKLLDMNDGNFVTTEANLYLNTVEKGRGAAVDCIECGQCEKVCPQKLPIMTYLWKCICGEIEQQLPPGLREEYAAKHVEREKTTKLGPLPESQVKVVEYKDTK